MICCGIDIGTNTVRMMIADVDPLNKVINKILYTDRVITRLGRDLCKTGMLSSESIDKSISALNKFKKEINNFKVSKISIVATSAVREASNADVFIKESALIGMDVSIISPEEEAFYTYLGIRVGLSDIKDKMTFFDIGGGSTEIILVEQGKPSLCCSIPLGVVKLSDEFGFNKPITPEVVESCSKFINKEISKIFKGTDFNPDIVVGTAGSVTSIAAYNLGLDTYNYEMIKSHIISNDSLCRLIDELSPLTSAEKLLIPGVTYGREDLIVCSAIFVREILKFFNSDKLIVSGYGLIEGVIIKTIY